MSVRAKTIRVMVLFASALDGGRGDYAVSQHVRRAAVIDCRARRRPAACDFEGMT